MNPFEQDLPLLAQIPAPLLRWYDAGNRVLPWRSDPQPYYVWLSEIMLQQTRVEAATPYFERFIASLPTIADLAAAPEEQLLKLWEGLGYYNRVRNLQKAARVVMDEYGGRLPADFEALQTLPGIGRYSAGAIGSIAFGIAVPAVDGNVLRVLSRVLASEADIAREEVKRNMGAALVQVLPKKRPGDFNQALMELGAMVCLPNGAPHCEVCPLAGLCRAKAGNLTEQLPRKAAKKARRTEQHTVFLLFQNGRVGVQKRPDTGLLRSLWGLPGTPGHLTPNEAEQALVSLGFTVATLQSAGKAKHVFTHIEWQMQGYAASVGGQCDGIVFVDPQQLADDYCLPSAFRAYTGQISTFLGAQDDNTQL